MSERNMQLSGVEGNDIKRRISFSKTLVTFYHFYNYRSTNINIWTYGFYIFIILHINNFEYDLQLSHPTFNLEEGKVVTY